MRIFLSILVLFFCVSAIAQSGTIVSMPQNSVAENFAFKEVTTKPANPALNRYAWIYYDPTHRILYVWNRVSNKMDTIYTYPVTGGITYQRQVYAAAGLIKINDSTLANDQSFIRGSFSVAKSPLSYNSSTGVFDFDSANWHSRNFYNTVYQPSGNYEPAITPGTSAQYFRGDKTFQILNTSVVPEITNLYFTQARARQSLSLTTAGTGAATYDNSTGIFNVPTPTTSSLGAEPSQSGNGYVFKNGATTSYYAPTAGYIQYGTGTALAGSNNLFWDATNSRQGIGTNLPLHPLHIKTVYIAGQTGANTLALENTNTGVIDAGPSIGFYGNSGNTSQLFYGALSFLKESSGISSRAYLSIRSAEREVIRVGSGGKTVFYGSDNTGLINVLGTGLKTMAIPQGSSSASVNITPTYLYSFSHDTAVGAYFQTITSLTNTYALSLSGSFTGGSGYTNGTYPYVTLTNTGGTLAVFADLIVSGGAVTSVTFKGASPGWAAGATVVISAGQAGLSSVGSGFSTTIGTIGTPNVASYAIVNQGNALFRGGKIQYLDGNQAAGKVLTSDVGGNASWQNILFSAHVSFSGTGSATSFTIAHGLTGITSNSKVFVTPRNSATAGITYANLDATYVTIYYSVAPASGTNNLTIDYQIIP